MYPFDEIGPLRGLLFGDRLDSGDYFLPTPDLYRLTALDSVEKAPEVVLKIAHINDFHVLHYVVQNLLGQDSFPARGIGPEPGSRGTSSTRLIPLASTTRRKRRRPERPSSDS